jgi:hypothetical protein
MAKQYRILKLEGINWANHYDAENEIAFTDFFTTKEIEVGDTVSVENKEECVLPLDEDEYCVTFRILRAELHFLWRYHFQKKNVNSFLVKILIIECLCSLIMVVIF